MITAVALAGYAVLVGAVLPSVLAGARWPHRAPALALLLWHGLMATFVIAATLGAYHLALPADDRHAHDGVVGLLGACGLDLDIPAGGPASLLADALVLAVPAVFVLLPLGRLVRCALRARLARQRHLDILTVVGESAPAYGATVVDHAVPAVYCLPGRCRRIVVTRGAMDVLSEDQLRSVLEHERAHLEGRHHLLHLLADAFSRAFPGLPLARHAREQTALLVEMIADDRALRCHPREVLATALCEVAVGRVPQAALGAGGTGSLIRLRRILTPPPRPNRLARLGLMTAAVAAPFLPPLMACVH
jgi:hypothetical protein